MSVTPEKRFLGFEAAKYTDRSLLGLAEDDALKSGQVEAALEQRLDVIARHPLGKSAEAMRLVAKLELAADRLQAEIALTGRGPLHPKAARRAAARMAAGGAASVGGAQAGADAPVARRPVVAPTAISKPGLGLTADDLTDFDRVALAVLVVSGGWNASSAKRLATIAGEYGVSVDDLEKVVLGLTQFLSEGAGLQGAMGDVGESATATWMSGPRLTRADAAEGAVERVFTRINDVLRDEVGGGTAASRMRLTVIFALFALSWIGALGYLFFGGGGKPDDVPTTLPGAPAVADATPAPAARGDVDANGKPVGPIDALAAPAKFPRPPGFVPTPTPAVVAESASAAPSWVADLEEAARALAAAKGRFDGGRADNGRADGASDAERARTLFVGALSRAADAWPAAGGYRGDVLRALGSVVRTAQGADSLRKIMTAMPGGESDVPPPGMPQWQREWRHAFGAGCLAVVAVDPAFAPEVAAAAREEMRQRNLPIPRGSAADPFGAASTAALAAGMPHLAERIAFGTSGVEDVARWNEAVLAAASAPRLRIDALVAAIDAVLRAPGALDKPGPVVDALAFFIRSLDFTGRGAEADAVRNALSAWILDKNIPPSRIWVFTSLLDADLGIAWYGPDLVLATNATDAARAALAERVDLAFPRVSTTVAGEAVLVDESQMSQWKAGLDQVWALEQTNEVERLRNAAIALSVVRAYRGFERSDERIVKSAFAAMDELVSREPAEWIAPPAGMRGGIPASGVSDGTFVDEWARDRTPRARLDAIRALRSRPAAGDLGPLDARLAASEALRGGQVETRQELCAVLMERYSNGREVLRALLDALADMSGGSDEARLFVGAMSGATVAGRDWIAEGRRALLEKIVQLEDSTSHAVDLAVSEIVAQATATAVSFGKADAAAAGGASRPERALAAACDAIRSEAASRFLAEPFPAPVEEIERLRAARRSLARSVSQRMAAETPAMVDYAAMLVVARQPALRSTVAEMVASARSMRAAAATATEQLMGDLYTVLSILDADVAPKPTERASG
ncbi:MAG: hypothetical protein RL354_400 [Planctomycetota bacterium]